MNLGAIELLKRAFAVFAKDITCEFRTRFAINAILLFAVTTLLAVSFAIGGVGLSGSIQAALLWIVIYFSGLSGLSRSFVHEEESGTSNLLRLSSSPGAIFGGKLIFNLILLAGLEIVIVPLFVGMMSLQVANWPLFVSILIVGSLGLAVSATIVAAIVSKANTKGALFAVLSFPVLLPILIAGIHGTRSAIMNSVFSSGMQDLKLLVSYTGVMFVIASLIFKFVWED